MDKTDPSATWTEEEIRVKYLELTDAITQNPYDVKAWQARGDFFRSTDYHDLAIGDFYKALLLIDDALDTSGEYHQQALSAFGIEPSENDGSDDEDEVRPATALPFKRLALQCYADLAECLWDIGARKSAQRYYELGSSLNFDEVRPTDLGLVTNMARLLEFQTERLRSTDEAELVDQAHARRELYPWNTHEPDRYSSASIDLLNAQLASVAPKCIVKAVDLPVLHASASASNSTLDVDATPNVVKQLGLFAKEDVAPGELLLKESSLLAVNNRLYDELCDACSGELPTDPAKAHACEECMTAVFCSKDCLEKAMAAYHPAVCGNEAIEAINKDPDAKDSSDALYGLLLGRAIAMAETQDINPLDLIEIAFLWGDYSPWEAPSKADPNQDLRKGMPAERPRTLPWTFEQNIANPIHLLTLLDLDIFSSIDKYDLWMLNTLLARFRGVANARMNARTGRPEVAASHFRWCLANHSCAPNVTWEWGGEIKMWARGGEHGEVVRWGKGREEDDGDGNGSGRWQGGLKEGEEVLNHYCDVRLPVRERREWAAGALGGMCICERCVWEATNEERGKEEKVRK